MTTATPMSGHSEATCAAVLLLDLKNTTIKDKQVALQSQDISGQKILMIINTLSFSIVLS